MNEKLLSRYENTLLADGSFLMRGHNIRGGNGAYRLAGLIAAALVVAIASFEDRLALAIGRAGMLAALGLFAFVLLGAALSVFRRTAVKPPVATVDVSVRRPADVSHPQSS